MIGGMRIFVTGGGGYIGSRVVAHFLGRGARVIAYDSLAYGGAGLLPFIGSPSFQLIDGDIRDRHALEAAMRGADAVLHFAAIVGEPACALDDATAQEVNHGAAAVTMNLADTLRVERFVFFSTCSNYGAANAGALVDEEAPLDPLSTYARTKVAAELSALEGNRFTAATVLRLGTICGLSGRMRFDLLVNDMARAAALGRRIDIYKPEAWRPYLHVADVGRVVEHVLTMKPARVARRVFNVVAENYRKSDLVDLVRKHFPETEIAIIEAQPDNRDYRVSGERVKRELGFGTAHTVEDALVEVAAAVRAGVFIDPMWPGYSALPAEAASRG